MRVEDIGAIHRIKDKRATALDPSNVGKSHHARTETGSYSVPVHQADPTCFATTTPDIGNNNRCVYEIRDRMSGEITSEVPSEQVLQVAKSISEFLDQNEGQADVDKKFQEF